MDIRKILNPEEPTPTTSAPKQPPKKDRPAPGERDTGPKDLEEGRRKRGMPIEGLNTFRVRNH